MAPAQRATWLRSDQLLARSIAQPIARFLAIEASGGLLLVAAAVVALVWANSPWQASYFDLWHTELTLQVGDHVVSEDLQHWINDGLMTLFFFVIGLEIKHEVTHGQLTSPRAAAIPIAGAIGGMMLPAALYAVVNLGGEGGSGWGIPMATDIAFAVGVLALLGDRVPAELKVLLLGLAIVDDIGAILVIALFYTDQVALGWLAGGVAILVAMVLLDQARVRYLPVYVLLGVAVWFTFYESGVHATLAGVALGLLAPSRAFLPAVDADRIAGELSADQAVTASEVRDISFRIRESVPVTERLEDVLHPWTSYLVVPLFALANAGIVLSGDGLRAALESPVTLGVVVGLVGGKLVGVTAAIVLVQKLRLGHLPEGVTFRHVVGMGAMAGIGFTVSIFVGGLAFDAADLTNEATLGVLIASVVAALLGASILRTSRVAEPGR